ncbi:hypothetical protein VaNZ11_016123, partial [Volvox africanus]
RDHRRFPAAPFVGTEPGPGPGAGADSLASPFGTSASSSAALAVVITPRPKPQAQLFANRGDPTGSEVVAQGLQVVPAGATARRDSGVALYRLSSPAGRKSVISETTLPFAFPAAVATSPGATAGGEARNTPVSPVELTAVAIPPTRLQQDLTACSTAAQRLRTLYRNCGFSSSEMSTDSDEERDDVVGGRREKGAKGGAAENGKEVCSPPAAAAAAAAYSMSPRAPGLPPKGAAATAGAIGAEAVLTLGHARGMGLMVRPQVPPPPSVGDVLEVALYGTGAPAANATQLAERIQSWWLRGSEEADADDNDNGDGDGDGGGGGGGDDRRTPAAAAAAPSSKLLSWPGWSAVKMLCAGVEDEIVQKMTEGKNDWGAAVNVAAPSSSNPTVSSVDGGGGGGGCHVLWESPAFGGPLCAGRELTVAALLPEKPCKPVVPSPLVARVLAALEQERIAGRFLRLPAAVVWGDGCPISAGEGAIAAEDDLWMVAPPPPQLRALEAAAFAPPQPSQPRGETRAHSIPSSFGDGGSAAPQDIAASSSAVHPETSVAMAYFQHEVKVFNELYEEESRGLAQRRATVVPNVTFRPLDTEELVTTIAR